MDWVKLETDFEGHPKVLGAGLAGAGLYARALAFCGRYETDGKVPDAWVAQAVAHEGQSELPERLVASGLWSECEGGYEICDFTQINKSREEMDDLRQQRSNAGQASAKARAKQKRNKGSTLVEHGVLSTSYSSSDSSSTSVFGNSTSTTTAASRAREAGFDEWLADHSTVTGRSVPAQTTKTYARLAGQYVACLGEGADLEALKLASRGAHGNDHRRENGYDKAENVLRTSKVLGLVDDGRRLSRGLFGKTTPAEHPADRRIRELAEDAA